ncbi:MAG TPA: septation protein SepH [Kineosporiaceae bacterium]
MHDLKLVGVHDDGEHLVLSAADGQKYLLLVDDPLRAAVRLDRARLGQLQIQTEGKLRPRDIQARIRAGQTAEEVAVASGLPVEHIRRFEGPVIAEREFVVRQAQAVRVRRGARGTSVALGELVGERLAARAVEENVLAWDAWRAEDGVWIVALTFVAGSRQRQACWSYDAQLRHVTPRDDEARWLTDDDIEEPGQRPRRLTPVSGRRDQDPVPAEGSSRDHVYDVEADGGVRPADGPRPALARATVDLLDSLRERRGRRQRTSPPGDPEIAGGSLTGDPMDAALHGGAGSRRPGRGDFDDLPAAHPPASRPDLADDNEILALTDLGEGLPPDLYDDGFADPYREAPVLRDEEDDEQAPPPAAPPAAALPAAAPPPAGPPSTGVVGDSDVTGSDRAAARRARRASVPKWDDIVFGSRRE